jgi:hypothetical protein
MSLGLQAYPSLLQMLFAAFPIVFQQERGWSPGIGGLAFLGVLVGFIIALAYIIFIENPRYSRKLKVSRLSLLMFSLGLELMAYYRLKAAGWLRNIGYHPRSLVVFSCQSYVPRPLSHLPPLTFLPV